MSIIRDCHLAIEALIPRGYPAIEQVADRMGSSVRTLQRRLHETGASYSTLVDQVRYELACKRLETTDMYIGEVAKDLGFKDHSSFSRAFHRWTGVSPKAYRQSVQRAGPEHQAPGDIPVPEMSDSNAAGCETIVVTNRIKK